MWIEIDSSLFPPQAKFQTDMNTYNLSTFNAKSMKIAC